MKKRTTTILFILIGEINLAQYRTKNETANKAHVNVIIYNL